MLIGLGSRAYVHTNFIKYNKERRQAACTVCCMSGTPPVKLRALRGQCPWARSRDSRLLRPEARATHRNYQLPSLHGHACPPAWQPWASYEGSRPMPKTEARNTWSAMTSRRGDSPGADALGRDLLDEPKARISYLYVASWRYCWRPSRILAAHPTGQTQQGGLGSRVWCLEFGV